MTVEQITKKYPGTILTVLGFVLVFFLSPLVSEYIRYEFQQASKEEERRELLEKSRGEQIKEVNDRITNMDLRVSAQLQEIKNMLEVESVKREANKVRTETRFEKIEDDIQKLYELHRKTTE